MSANLHRVGIDVLKRICAPATGTPIRIWRHLNLGLTTWEVTL
jgi:hypothetical protein